jgi:hypothetical protein
LNRLLIGRFLFYLTTVLGRAFLVRWGFLAPRGGSKQVTNTLWVDVAIYNAAPIRSLEEHTTLTFKRSRL